MDKPKKVEYTPQEVTIEILEKVKKLYQNSNLNKSNTAHEIEGGSEPSTPDAECPESLKVGEVMKPDKSGDKKKKNKSSMDLDGNEELEEEMDAEAHERDEEDLDFIEEEAESEDEQLGNEDLEELSPEDEDLEDEDLEDEDLEDEDLEDEFEEDDNEKIIENASKDKKNKFSKSEDMRKSLFALKEALKSEPIKEVDEYPSTKQDIICEIQCKIEKLDKFKSHKWLIEEEFPKHKELFNKIFNQFKSEIIKLIEKYTKVKKSENSIDKLNIFLAKKFVDKAVGLAPPKSDKLQSFLKKKLKKKQGVPKGADPVTHERCVKKVKTQGHDKSSAYAICNEAKAGMKKSKRIDAEERRRMTIDAPSYQQQKKKLQMEQSRARQVKLNRKKIKRKPDPCRRKVDPNRKGAGVLSKNKKVEKLLGIEGKAVKPSNYEKPKMPKIPQPPKINSGY